jgi:Fe-S-cluster formation regulator IscX/YfhJ
MTQPVLTLPDLDDDAAEALALAAAVAEARADPRGVPHAEMREWLLRIAAGDFAAKAPEPRLL